MYQPHTAAVFRHHCDCSHPCQSTLTPCHRQRHQRHTVPTDPSIPATGAPPTRVCEPASHREPQQAAARARAILRLMLTLTGFHIPPWTVTCEIYAKKQKFPLWKNVQAARASLLAGPPPFFSPLSSRHPGHTQLFTGRTVRKQNRAVPVLSKGTWPAHSVHKDYDCPDDINLVPARISLPF